MRTYAHVYKSQPPPVVVFSAARSRMASYKTAAKRRERMEVEQQIRVWLRRVDPDDLLMRPLDELGWQRLVDHWIKLSYARLGGEELDIDAIRPRLPDPRIKEGTRGERAIKFIETFCRVPEGPKVGQAMVLDEFQKQFILDVLDNPNKTKEGILSIAKKNGKTGLIAAFMLVFLVGPEAKLPNSQIVSGAMEREQAALVLKYATKMIQLSPVLFRLIRVVARKLFGLMRNIEYRALAAVAKSTQGISPILAILDEIGQIEGPESSFVSAIETAQGAYDDALRLVISTQAANDGDLLSLKIDHALEAKDPQVVCHFYAADPDCKLDDEAQWRKANPGLGTIRSIEDMRYLARDAESLPSKEGAFRNLNLNQRVQALSGFVSPDVWSGCGAKPGKIEGKRIHLGLDLAETTDLCALVAESEEGDVWPFFWLPDKGLKERAKHDKVPYLAWRDKGFLFTTPGPTVEYEHLAEFLRGIFDKAVVLSCGFDRYNMKHLLPWLKKAGFTEEEMAKFIPFGQGFISMSPAIRDLESKLLNKKLHHGNHPILQWCVANTVIERDSAGNRKFNKQKARRRIDGAVALAMANGMMLPLPSEDKPQEKKYQLFVL